MPLVSCLNKTKKINDENYKYVESSHNAMSLLGIQSKKNILVPRLTEIHRNTHKFTEYKFHLTTFSMFQI